MTRLCSVLSLLLLLTPVAVQADSGIYQQGPHTLFYLPLDGPNAGGQENCSIVDPLNILSYIPDRFGNVEAAIHVAGSGSWNDMFYIGCQNTKIGSSSSPSFTVGYWIRVDEPLSPGAYQYCDTYITCGYRIFTVWASGFNSGCTKYLVAEAAAANTEGAWPFGCSVGDDNINTPFSTASISDGGWHNVLWVFDYSGKSIKLYLDGSLNVVGALPNPSVTAQNQQWVAGAENGTIALNGDLDDLWVEDHAWSDSEIVQYFTGPALTFSPPSLVFAGKGSSSLTLSNFGTTTLSITAPPTFAGFNASDFSLAADSTCTNGTTIAPGGSCGLDVTFAPSTTSAESAALLVFNSSNGTPQTASVSGGAAITSVSPNPVLGLLRSQLITVAGNGFQMGQVLRFQSLKTSNKVVTVTPNIISSTQLTATLPFVDKSGTWEIQVANPNDLNCDSDPQPQNCYSFEVTGTDYSRVNVNDYPFQNSPFDSTKSASCKLGTVDPYGFCYRECTSYVAWRMNRNAGTTDYRTSPFFFFNRMGGGLWGAASNWASNAKSLGYTVDSTPEVGAIAQWVTMNHVAYVEQVNSDGSLVVTQYNYKGDDSGVKHQFGVRTIFPAKGYPDNFIHVPFIAVSSSSLVFGSQKTGTTTSQTLTLWNTGSLTANVTEIVSKATQFSVSPSNCTTSNPCTIAPGASFQITVQFTPTSQGRFATKLGIQYSNGPGLPTLSEAIALTGSGT